MFANNGGIAEIEVEGAQDDLDAFLKELSKHPPQLSSIEKIDTLICPVRAENAGFRIIESKNDLEGERFVATDAATCSKCLEELFSPNNRRYLYPFINCIDCGPRFTIDESLPYDRPATTMNCFKMCVECQAEYNDPANRSISCAA